MHGHEVFSIPKTTIPNKFFKINNWEKYDENCLRGHIKINNLTNIILDNILKYNKSGLKRTKEYSIHNIKYSLRSKNFYEISKHEDNCYFTLIIYLHKSSEINDEFWVNNIKINEALWSEDCNMYNCLLFWGNLPHQGNIFGNGSREILCFFVG